MPECPSFLPYLLYGFIETMYFLNTVLREPNECDAMMSPLPATSPLLLLSGRRDGQILHLQGAEVRALFGSDFQFAPCDYTFLFQNHPPFGDAIGRLIRGEAVPKVIKLANAVYQISTQETGSENFTLLAYRLPDSSDGDHESTNESNSELHRLNDELAARNEELLEIVASRDKFISIIAHDIKNPFTALLGFSEFLFKNIDNVDKEEIEEIARAMFQSSRLIFSFLENLLQWARLRTDRIEFNPVMIDLYAVTEGITELLTDNAQLKDITLSNAIPEGTWVFADEPSISSVLRNLISNAIKFSRKGGKVTVSSQIKDDYVHVQVSDSGVGMRQEDVAKIFRIDKSHTTVGTNNERGTGLGLKLCKEFVERNGGTIWVESTLNKGSIFTFTLYRKVKAEMV